MEQGRTQWICLQETPENNLWFSYVHLEFRWRLPFFLKQNQTEKHILTATGNLFSDSHTFCYYRGSLKKRKSKAKIREWWWVALEMYFDVNKFTCFITNWSIEQWENPVVMRYFCMNWKWQKSCHVYNHFYRSHLIRHQNNADENSPFNSSEVKKCAQI